MTRHWSEPDRSRQDRHDSRTRKRSLVVSPAPAAVAGLSVSYRTKWALGSSGQRNTETAEIIERLTQANPCCRLRAGEYSGAARPAITLFLGGRRPRTASGQSPGWANSGPRRLADSQPVLFQDSTFRFETDVQPSS